MNTRGKILTEGKTKIITEHNRRQDVVFVENKDVITALDDPNLTQSLTGKAAACNETTCRVFELLKDAGVPVAYQRQLDDTTFLALNCQMISLEVVGRRFATGSALVRCPEVLSQQPYPKIGLVRFQTPIVEFFLKTTQGVFISHQGKPVICDLNPAAGEEDPFIGDPWHSPWQLLHPKKRLNTPESDLGKQVNPITVLGEDWESHLTKMRYATLQAFLVLEASWRQLDHTLVDFKVEFGFHDDKIYLADDLHSDSWRLLNAQGKDVSKQTFREGGELQNILHNYREVANLAGQLRLVV